MPQRPFRDVENFWFC